MRKLLFPLFVFVCALLQTTSTQSNPPLLLRFPTVSKTQIVFNYAGDLWIVSRDGGDAHRLTSGVGIEALPSSPPTGPDRLHRRVRRQPRRLRRARDRRRAPAPDLSSGGRTTSSAGPPTASSVLFSLAAQPASPLRGQLFTVPVEGGFPTQLPLPIAVEASFSPDGRTLAYVPHRQWQRAWKRYRGGQTHPDLDRRLSPTPASTRFPATTRTTSIPMWVGDTIYFLSDRNGPVTLFAYDTKSKQVTEVVKNDGLDFKSASAGPGAIVYRAVRRHSSSSTSRPTRPRP